MLNIDAVKINFKNLNDIIKASENKAITINNCIGQRYIGCGLNSKNLLINGTPGNALGAYLNGAVIRVNGNAQDATGDTMNEGEIYVHGSTGDATGYAMRGGKIFVKGNTGYRAGIHMKAYQDKLPLLVIGGSAGCYLGEYLAGGTIIVLGLDKTISPIVGQLCGTGMHGGKIYLRCNSKPSYLPKQVIAKKASIDDMNEIVDYIDTFCNEFKFNKQEILSHQFYVLIPDTKNPYEQLYTHN